MEVKINAGLSVGYFFVEKVIAIEALIKISFWDKWLSGILPILGIAYVIARGDTHGADVFWKPLHMGTHHGSSLFAIFFSVHLETCMRNLLSCRHQTRDQSLAHSISPCDQIVLYRI